MTTDLTALQSAVAKLAEILRECCVMQRDDAVANQLFPLAVEWQERMDQCKAIARQFAEAKEEEQADA